MDNHTISWGQIAVFFGIGYGVGAASVALLLGLLRAIRRATEEDLWP